VISSGAAAIQIRAGMKAAEIEPAARVVRSVDHEADAAGTTSRTTIRDRERADRLGPWLRD